MAQDIPIRCDECRFIIGRLTTTIHGNYQMSVSGKDFELQASTDQQMPKREQNAQQSVRINAPDRERGF